jgi:hypothetical protein
MKFFRRSPKRVLPPIPQHVIDAHNEALAVKKEAAERAPIFKELADNMIHRHRVNGFGQKLEATYRGRGLL